MLQAVDVLRLGVYAPLGSKRVYLLLSRRELLSITAFIR